MNKIVKKKYEMFREILKVLNNLKPEWENKQHIVNSVGELEAKYNLLEEEIATHSLLKDGVPNFKKGFRERTESKALLVVALLKAFAEVTHNDELLLQLRYTKSGFKHGGAKDVVFDAGQIHELGTAHLPAASFFGVSQALLDDLELNRVGLKNNVNKPQDQRILRQECGERIDILIKDIDDLLKDRFDNQMEVFKDSKSEIYIVYHLARRGVDPITIKLALRCKITDAQTKEPVAKAMVAIKSIFKRKSSPKGQVILRNLPEGKYNLSVSMPGYVTQTIKISRVKAATCKVNVELVRS